MIRSAIKQWHNDLKARMARGIRTKDAIQVLSIMHAQELATTPGEQWALVKQKQSTEIRAVRDGKFDIVDRRSWPLPFLPESLHRLTQPLIKNTPYNLRRFAETPIVRRAMNLIKNAILALTWDIIPVEDSDNENPERELRIRIAKACLKHPSNDESWRTLLEAGLDDLLSIGVAVFEPQMTPSPRRPVKLWAVDGNTIRKFLDWTESAPEKPKYAQMTGLKGERGLVAFRAEELIYIMENVRTSSPFGLGKLEVAFNAVNAFLGAQDAASRAAADQVHKTWLFWEQTQSPAHLNTIRRHITNELEGQAKISLMMGMKKPDVVDVQPVTPDDLLIPWQELLIRIIAAAFDLSPMALGLERDVNRNTASVMAMGDFKAAVLPTARRIEEALTRKLLHQYLGWRDLKFSFLNLEDPDMQTMIMLMQRQYAMNALTPNQVNEKLGMPPIPGGWGDMTQLQSMIFAEVASTMIQNAAAKDQQANAPQPFPAAPGMQYPGMPPQHGQPQMPGAPGASQFNKGPQASPSVSKMTGLKPIKAPKLSQMPGTMGVPSAPRATNSGGGSMRMSADSANAKNNTIPFAKKKPGKFGSAGKGTVPGAKFSPDDIAKMSPDEVKQHQKTGMLPQNKKEISDGMEELVPGIMQQLTKALQDFFDELKKEGEDDNSTEVDPITPALEKEQEEKFEEAQHKDTDMEKVLNRRGSTQSVAGPGSRTARKANKGLKNATATKVRAGVRPRK
jgi:hypothetical protein